MDGLSEMSGFWLLLAAAIGLVLGSFASVVVWRLPLMMARSALAFESVEEGGSTRYNLCFPGSACAHCAAPIPWYYNVPIWGYLCLKGRCASCGQSISLRYLLLEWGMALIAVTLMVRFGPGMSWIWALVLSLSLLCMSVIDFDHQILPDDLTLPTLWLGLILSVFDVFVESRSSILGAALGYGVFWAIHHLFRLISGREGLGQGDFKLLALLGAWLGFAQLPALIFLASVTGAGVGLLLIATGRSRRTDPIPFGPFLAAAGWLLLVLGPIPADWFVSFGG